MSTSSGSCRSRSRISSKNCKITEYWVRVVIAVGIWVWIGVTVGVWVGTKVRIKIRVRIRNIIRVTAIRLGVGEGTGVE